MSIIRDVTLVAEKYLDTDETMIFTGARQAGKTTILRQLEDKLKVDGHVPFFINLEDPEFLDLLNAHPENIFKIHHFNLQKRNFLLIDEIQYLNNPTNFIKYIYDEYKGRIKLIVTGSSAFYLDRKFKDSLAGRKIILHVFTLSFNEYLRFKGVNVPKDFSNFDLTKQREISNYYREYMLYGGYPKVVLAEESQKQDILRDLAYSYIKKDIYEAGIRRGNDFYKLLKILAVQSGQLVNVSELANTLNISVTAVENFLYVMEKSGHIFLIRPFHGNIRKELTKMPKAYWLDLGLRNMFLDNWKEFDLREDKGSILENAAFRQLAIKYGAENVKFWRTVQGHEIDFIVNDKAAYEAKSNYSKIKNINLRSFKEKYPQIPVSLITIDKGESIFNGYPVLNVWEV
jgi:hypothetical protein